MLNGNRVNAIRARARRGWSVKKIARALRVSRNTVRRYTGQGATARGSPTKTPLTVQQELDWVRRIARRWAMHDPDDLESDLTDKLAEIYSQKTVVANWQGFLITALNRAAINWLRARKRRERRVIPDGLLSPEPAAHQACADRLTAFDVGRDDKPLFERVRRVLSGFLRRVWNALVAEDFNQTRAAQRLGVHRNTIRRAIRQIRMVLRRHGL